MNPQPGDVWLADLGLAAKTRPVIIVSRYDRDPPRALILYIPLTTQNRQSSYEVVLPHLGLLDRDSVVCGKCAGTRLPADGAARAEASQTTRRSHGRDHERPRICIGFLDGCLASQPSAARLFVERCARFVAPPPYASL
jgi:hypothetical protein